MAQGSNGQRKLWFITPLIAVASIIFGAGGMAYSTCDRLTVQEKHIDALTAKTAGLEIVAARIDERFKAIDQSLKRIEIKMDTVHP